MLRKSTPQDGANKPRQSRAAGAGRQKRQDSNALSLLLSVVATTWLGFPILVRLAALGFLCFRTRRHRGLRLSLVAGLGLLSTALLARLLVAWLLRDRSRHLALNRLRPSLAAHVGRLSRHGALGARLGAAAFGCDPWGRADGIAW